MGYMKRHVSMATSFKNIFPDCLYERWMRYDRWKEEKGLINYSL